MSDHAGHAHAAEGWKLGVAFFLSFGILAALVVGGLWSHSLALLADAGHSVTDIAALGLSWFAVRQAQRPATPARTYGYHRVGILAALMNATGLILIAGFVTWEAYNRLSHPPEVQSSIMVVAASVGLVINLGLSRWLSGHAEGSLNVRSAFMHVLGDALASGGVIVGAVVIALTGWHVVDPLLSVAIALLIAHGAWKLADESVGILMEGTPKDLDLGKVQADLAAVPGVLGVRELHVWSITSGKTCMSCHVLVDPAVEPSPLEVVSACARMLEQRHRIDHTAIQPDATNGPARAADHPHEHE